MNSDILQLVTFTLGSEEYGVEILKVQEINRMTEITGVPNAPAYLDGVINLRGKVIPVVSLRAKFGLPRKENDEQSRIIILDIMGVTMGLIVDAVSEVLRISAQTVEPTPQMAANVSTEFIRGIAKLEKRLNEMSGTKSSPIILLELDRLLGAENRAAIGHAAQKAIEAA